MVGPDSAKTALAVGWAEGMRTMMTAAKRKCSGPRRLCLPLLAGALLLAVGCGGESDNGLYTPPWLDSGAADAAKDVRGNEAGDSANDGAVDAASDSPADGAVDAASDSTGDGSVDAPSHPTADAGPDGTDAAADAADGGDGDG